MYSFYGGRPGNAFVIVTTFRSVSDMIDAFSQGPNYTDVHYDEYVMINTVNRDNPDNGKIYRRGYNFNEIKDGVATGGAQFIGTIVGPSGSAPTLYMTDISTVNDKQAQDGYELIRTSGSYSVNNSNLIPGRSVSNNNTITYNDEIQWACCSVRDPDH